MQSLVNNFLVGNPATVITVGIIFFAVLFIAAVAIFGYTVHLQAKQGFTLAIMIAFSLLIPFTIRQTFLQQNTASKASAEITVTNIVFEQSQGKRSVRFTTSDPALVYLQYEVGEKVADVLPSYYLSQRAIHEFVIENIPAEVRSLSIIINGQKSEQSITLP